MHIDASPCAIAELVLTWQNMRSLSVPPSSAPIWDMDNDLLAYTKSPTYLRGLALQEADLHAVRLHCIWDAHVRRRDQALRDPPVTAEWKPRGECSAQPKSKAMLVDDSAADGSPHGSESRIARLVTVNDLATSTGARKQAPSRTQRQRREWPSQAHL